MTTSTVRPLLLRARAAWRSLRQLPGPIRDRALEEIAVAIERDQEVILDANREDLEGASSLSDALKDRLSLDSTRVLAMARAVRNVKALSDPLAEERSLGVGRSGIQVARRRIPLGVIAVIYEARPNVTAECASLTIKSGNAVVLRGGQEAERSNRAIHCALQQGMRSAGVPEDAVLLVTGGGRDSVSEILGATGLVDLAIPRGGAGLMALVETHARVPIIRHGEGICHVYVDRGADRAMAVNIAFNAKVQRPGVCNAMETLLVHKDRLDDVLGILGPKLAASGVELRADERALAALSRVSAHARAAAPSDWDTEFLDLVLAIRTVDGLEQALDHIHAHGTHHTASIVTEDRSSAERFLEEVEASCVLWNASTRFNDGGELGLGAEMGISTSRMHAYGPMSVRELTAEKLVVRGSGQVRG